MDLSIIIPVYNEEEVIESTLLDVVDFLKKLQLNYEIIVVDDGSNDETKKIVNSLNITNLTLLEHNKNSGKGISVKDGVLFSKGAYILFMDADSSTPINYLTNLLTQLSLKSADIAIASRALLESKINVRQSKYKEKLGQAGNWLINKILKLNIRDTQCGFKLFKKESKKIFQMQTLNGFSFDIELMYLAKRYGFKIIEVPITWSNNPKSRVKLIDYFKTIIDIFKIKFRKYE